MSQERSTENRPLCGQAQHSTSDSELLQLVQILLQAVITCPLWLPYIRDKVGVKVQGKHRPNGTTTPITDSLRLRGQHTSHPRGWGDSSWGRLLPLADAGRQGHWGHHLRCRNCCCFHCLVSVGYSYGNRERCVAKYCRVWLRRQSASLWR